jgi:hypothetical protein
MNWLNFTADSPPPENKCLLLLLTFFDERNIGYEVIYTGKYRNGNFYVNSMCNDEDHYVNSMSKDYTTDKCFKWGDHNELCIDLGYLNLINIDGYKLL